MNRNTYDYVFKVIVIGDTGVGKTNLILRFSDQAFKDNYVATIGVDFKTKTITVGDKKVKLQLWDTAGQQRFRTITQAYYKGAAGIVLTYSINDRNSFENITKWMRQIKEKTPMTVQKLIVANKADIPEEERQVSYEEGKKLAEDLSEQKQKVPFMEVSAKQGTNVNQAFTQICEQIKEYVELNQQASTMSSGKSSIIKISPIEDDSKKDFGSSCHC